MQQSQDDSCPAAPEISHPLWDSSNRYRVNKNPVKDPSLNQNNPVKILFSYYFKTHLILASHLSLDLRKGKFLSHLLLSFCSHF
jgi:hypothetical protein